MHTIVAPLRPGDRNAEVANLQAGLVLLLTKQVIQLDPATRAELLNTLSSEMQEQIFKDGTQKSVAIFQEQNHLNPSALVDEPTAAALNEALRALGAFDNLPPTNRQQTVAGQVLRSRDQTSFEANIILFQESDQGSLRLGEDLTDPEGRYTINYALPVGTNGTGVKLRVSAYDDANQRRAEAIIMATRPVEVVNLTVQGEGQAFVVAGKVTSTTRAGIGGLRVVIVDMGVGGNQILIETTTQTDGTYHINFNYAGPKLKPDLQARAFRAETALGASEVRYNASTEETLNITVQEAADKVLATEHETLTSDLAQHFAGNLRDLKESDEQPDVTYLANKSSWDARAVALASLADQFTARTADPAGDNGIHPALFYALFRAGLPANDAALYRTDAASVAAIWKQGITQGIVPPRLEGELPAALERFQTLAARQVLDGPAIAGLSSLGEMLAVSLPQADTAQHEQFARLQIQHQGDPASFWEAVQTSFGESAAKRLQLDGQLSFLTLNNAPLTAKLHSAVQSPITDPVDLVEQGYHQPSKWLDLLDNASIPPEIEGADVAQRRSNYADVLATQLRVSYPTATLAAMVQSGETPTASGLAGKLHDFLLQNHSRFEIGMQPVEQFVASNQLEVDSAVLHELTRIQRVRQITPGDEAMNTLLRNNIDSAYAVVNYPQAEFVAAFGDAVGGETNAALIYTKAQQVHNAVLNLATSYLLASNAPGIGVHSPAQIVAPAPNVPANVGDVIAYPTLEKIFGEMDYCDCEHCRSVLSPAAYLVDLLQFLDRDPVRWGQFLSQWKKNHATAPYPFEDPAKWTAAGQPNNSEITPLTVLLSRRPDLQHLPLSCENTNIALPYIDLVNETLEYFIVNDLKLDDYTGHNTTTDATPEELMANPQFVQDAAYMLLAGQSNPAPLLPPTSQLPFHQPLENQRRYFAAFGAPLPRVMEALRKNETVERAGLDDYGWRDIWMEELQLSRAEYTRLTDRSLSLQELYGFTVATPDAAVLAALSNARDFTRRLEISYEELIELLSTRFINPDGTLIPRLERLGVSFATLKAFKDGTITDQQFDEALAPGLDASRYGGDIKNWVKNQTNYDAFMSLLGLTDPTGNNDPCNFDTLEFRYTDPARLAEPVRPLEFVRVLRFIRLWKKLGWSIEQTDKVIDALYPDDLRPVPTESDAKNLERLDSGFLILLPRLGVLKRVIGDLKLQLKADLLPLLACFAPLDTYGTISLYRKFFLSPVLLKQDTVFADDGYGNFLDGSQNLLDHQEALRAALTLTGDEFKRIGDALAFDAGTALTIDNVSAILRRSWLARKLKMSVQEFLLLVQFSGIDPFGAIDPTTPPLLRFIGLVNSLRSAGLKPSQALYLIWNQDLSANSAPDAAQINEFMRSLRATFGSIESEFTIVDDPDGQIARSRMALVYDNAATDLFFSLLNNTLVTDISYSHNQPALERFILDAAPGRIAYDDFRKRLSFTGLMTTTLRDALKVGVSLPFENAVNSLYAENQKIIGPFFARYPELQPIYDTYTASNDALEKKRSALLANFLPALKEHRKRQQAIQALSAAAKTEAAFAEAFLEDAGVLHAAGSPTRPALDDLTAVEQSGLSVQFFFRATASAPVDQSSETEPLLDYHNSSIKNRLDNKLPANGANPISAIWRGYLQVPESGFYNFRIETDPGAAVALSLADNALTLNQTGNLFSNASALELKAGTLYAFRLKVENVKDIVKVQWQSTGRGWEVIGAPYLYSTNLRNLLAQTYTRFFRAVSLTVALKLTANELAYLASHADYQIGGQGWFNSLPVAGSPDSPTSSALLTSLEALLDFARFKAALVPDDERWLLIFSDPLAATQKPDGLLFKLTRWEPDTLAALLDRFGKLNTDLAHLVTFRRVFEAYAWVTALGISATALIKASTNEPIALTVRNMQAALRARYAESDWLNLIKPINDQLRSLQRDALVAYIIHQMRLNPTSEHIDTPDKLFEYFLMDVQMDPSMQTSRIRHALSSVQLFIERCFMNLEPRVSATVLEAKQWEWMKRYRVWEANRKVFLWPENWLEPELRDDQSPFFKETMSELLQSDITEDGAAVALLNYLAKLDEVAKLEPCGIHYVENQPGKDDGIAHVVARTAGAGRKYYYRRREYGYWIPWEQIKLEIEDNPVIPVVWKNRLFLFWLRIMKQVPMDPGMKPISAPAGSDLTKIKVNQINFETPKIIVQALLCWSECYNGKWQPAKTSDVNKPTTLRQIIFLSGSGASGKFSNVQIDEAAVLFDPNEFDRSGLTLRPLEVEDRLIIRINGQRDQGSSSFSLFNTHSLPVREEDLSLSAIFPSDPRRYLNISNGQFIATYYHSASSRDRNVLTNSLTGMAVEPTHSLQNPWDAPFFYEDRRHVFYVTTIENPTAISEYKGYTGVIPTSPVYVPHIPPIVLQPGFRLKDRSGPVSQEQHSGISDPAPFARFVSEDAYIKQALGTAGTVVFGDKELGPTGVIQKQL